MQKLLKLNINYKKPLVVATLVLVSFMLSLLFFYLLPSDPNQSDAKLQDKLFKIRYSLLGKEHTSPYIVHLVLDNTSLNELGTYYFDRTMYGEMIDILKNAEVEQIVFDVFFQGKGDAEKDNFLTKAVGNANNVYLPIILYFNQDSSRAFQDLNPDVKEFINSQVWYPKLKLSRNAIKGNTIITPYEELLFNTKAFGHVNTKADSDGVHRRYPLIYSYKDGVIPSLALKSICDYLKVGEESIEVYYGRYIKIKNAMFPGGIIKDFDIPIDSQGRVDINFVAPWSDSFYEFSVQKLFLINDDPGLQSRLKEELNNSIVIVSDVSARTKDIGPGVFDHLYPNSEIHVSIANMILTQNFLKRMHWIFILGISITLAGILFFSFIKLTFKRFIILTCVLSVTYIISCILLFIFLNIIPTINFFIFSIFFSTLLLSFYNLLLLEKRNIKYTIDVKEHVIKEQGSTELAHFKSNIIERLIYNLKLPLNDAMAYLSKMEEASLDPKLVIDSRNQSKEIIQSAIEDIEDITGFRDGNQAKLLFEEIEPHIEINSVIKSFENQLHAKKIEVIVDTLAGKLKLWVNKKYFSKIVSNIFENAINFSKINGKINIEIENDIPIEQLQKIAINYDDEIKLFTSINIRDNGIGMSKKEIVHATDRFWKGEKSKSDKSLGIGLSVVKDLINAQKGYMHIESDLKNGTIVKLYFPLGCNHIKDIKLEEPEISLENNIEKESRESQTISNKQISKLNTNFKPIITQSPKMFQLFKEVEQYALSDEAILICGETGVGKELFAKAIHKVSDKPGPLMIENIAGVEKSMINDTLFGHKKGAFTGADSNREGLIKKAENGSLFLDEIGDMDRDLQVKLLRILDNKEYYPLGSSKVEKTNTRIIAATNIDIDEGIEKGIFREDLKYRFRHKIRIPALRERIEDIPILASHFLKSAGIKKEDQQHMLTKSVLNHLQNYTYPGNVRELEGMILSALTTSDSDGVKLSEERIRYYIKNSSQKNRLEIVQDSHKNYINFSGSFPQLNEVEEKLIEEAMNRTKGHQTNAAKLLGITRDSLRRRLKKSNMI